MLPLPLMKQATMRVLVSVTLLETAKWLLHAFQLQVRLRAGRRELHRQAKPQVLPHVIPLKAKEPVSRASEPVPQQ